VFEQIKADSDVRAVIVSGAGRLFTAGLDLTDNAISGMDRSRDPARTAYNLRPRILDLQETFTAIEMSDKPVIAVVHNGCIGAGVDLITACDIRLATKDAYFSVKEIDIGLAADLGTLQRLPKVMGNHSLVREICLTGRNFSAAEALQHGLVSKLLETKEEALAEALKLANDIASKSPVAVVGTKHLLNYSRDHSVAEGLAYTAFWNAAMLNTEDIAKCFESFTTKKKPKFAKL